MSQSVKCRQYAAECYDAARILSDNKKTNMIARAQSWLLLADIAERNSNLNPIYETPPRRKSNIG
jgi:hypothetical protein